MRYGDVGRITDVSHGTSANCMVVRPAQAWDFASSVPSPDLALTGIWYVVLLDGELIDYQKGKVCRAGDFGPVHERDVRWEGE